MATSQSIEDKASYEKEKERFVKEILQFHEARGTPARKVPKVNGYEIDLYLLYTLVTSRGGWVKVNSRNEWDQILDEFNIPKRCVNSDVAIKQIYLRYLDKYEKIHFHGELRDDEDDGSRHRQWNARTFHSVPMSYNHSQHNVNESLRASNGLSVDLYLASEYDKLALSLISPLPNEQDFAINVCTLLSNEGKHCLKLKKHPRILHFLLAHAAVFHDPSLRTLFHELYGKFRGHSMSHLWRDIVTDETILKLSDESQYVDWDDGLEDDSDGVSSKAGLTLEPEDRDIFCLGRTLGVQDFVGQRVSQIAAILRNLTFVTDNMLLMGKDLTFLRFIILCCHASWDSIHQMGWDMLCNVASEITERTPIMEQVLHLTREGMLSEDRADILSALEVLTKLAQNELNEELIIKSLKRDVYERICSFLSLHDIMLLVCTLECLNALTALGEKACNSVLGVHGVIDVLVSLVSVEAQSYGPKACIQMRVVETVRDFNSIGTGVPQSSTTTVQPPTTANSAPSTSHAASPSVPVVVTSSHQTPPRPQPVTISTSQARIVTASGSTTFSPQATEQIAQENEKFALAWLRCTYEPSSNTRIEQNELYKQYINYCAKIGRRGVIAPLHFPRMVRAVFGVAVGPKILATPEGNQQQVYEGIQIRSKPLVSTSIPTTNIIHSTPSSILKAQLSAPPKPTPTTPVKMQIVAEGNQSQGSAFMKTLLANKIVEHQKQQQLQQQQLQQQLQQSQVQQPTQQTNLQQQSQIVIQHDQTNPRDNPSPASVTFDDSSQSSTQDGMALKLNGVRSLMDMLGKPDSNTTVIASGNIRQSSNQVSTVSSVASDDVSTSNSSSIKGEPCEISMEENSKSSMDGFLNTVSVISDNLAAKEVKVAIKSEPPFNVPDVTEEATDGIDIKTENGVKVEKKEAVKRPHEKEEECNTKKPHLNGEESEEGTEEVTNASSSAANLYAALAADILEDEPIEETPVQVPQTQPTQILVTTGGQLAQVVGSQYVVPQGKNLAQDQKQTVLVAQTTQQQGTAAKTIIILQPQGSNVQAPQQVIRFQFPSTPGVIPSSQTSNIIRAIVPPKSSAGQTIQQITPTVITNTPSSQSSVGAPVSAPTATFVSVSSSGHIVSTANTQSSSQTSESKPSTESLQKHFICEWRGCMRNFNSENEVYLHACEAHLPQGSEEIQCLWERCDAMKRKRFSLMTHLYDKHCNPEEMKMVAVRRKQLSVTGRAEVSSSTSSAVPHPGYGPNAAYAAIKRHALDIVNVKDVQQRLVKPAPVVAPPEQANEGPVTKSIRLTSSLILRNLVVYSTSGRRHLMRYESFLACVALSNVESSRTIAHVLFDLTHSR